MKQSGLLLACLTAYTSAGIAADAVFSLADSTVTVPCVMDQGQMKTLDMTFQAPDTLTVDKMEVAMGGMMSATSGCVMYSADTDFRLSRLRIGSQVYQVDLAAQGGNQYKITNLWGRLTHLGTLDPAGGEFSYAYGISNSGLITGRSRGRMPTASGETIRSTINAVRFFSNGYVQDIGTLGADRAQGNDINDAGIVAGFSPIKTHDGSRVNHAFYNDYTTGASVDMGTLDNGLDSRAYGINNKNTVVGWSSSLADNSDNIAFSYDIETDIMASLGGDLLGGARSFAFDVSDNDHIVGTATTADGAAIAFLYQNGTTTNLGSLDNSGYSEARAVNNNGQVTGWSLDANKNYTAFIADANGMQSLGGLGGDSKGYDINIHGDVVGSALDAEGGQHAFLYRNGTFYDLYELLSAEDKAQWKELREAYGINDDGVIVGRGRYWTDKEAGRNASIAFSLTVVR